MPIRQYLNGQRFDFETTRVLGVALEMARCALRTEERGEDTDTIIAKHIIALALGASAMQIACAITPSPSSAKLMDVQVSCSRPPQRPEPIC